MDYTNLIYNADLTEGTKCWSGSNLTISNDVLTVTGNLTHSQIIPVSSNDTYRISFDIKFNTTDSPNFYIALQPFDSDKNAISISSTNKVNSTDTTLAQALANGNTTVTLSDTSNWDSTHANQRIGICNNLAWGYNRNILSAPYTSRSGNVITLKNAWTGGSFAIGTKISNFRDGSTYFYPVYFTVSNTSKDWKSYTATFQGGNSMRYSCQYFKFSTLGYSNNYSIKNIKIENTTSYQICGTPYITPQIYKSGNVHALFNECGRKIRYIKDSINGSSANAGNHWVEIQAYNIVGENCAFNKYNWTSSNTTKVKTCITDGSTATSPYNEGGTFRIVDLGFTEHINSIKIWHYWGDGRTYNDHVVSVSVDGTNWDTVYSGTHQESQNGFEIFLTPNKVSFQNTGFIDCSEIIEI